MKVVDSKGFEGVRQNANLCFLLGDIQSYALYKYFSKGFWAECILTALTLLQSDKVSFTPAKHKVAYFTSYKKLSVSPLARHPLSITIQFWGLNVLLTAAVPTFQRAGMGNITRNRGKGREQCSCGGSQQLNLVKQCAELRSTSIRRGVAVSAALGFGEIIRQPGWSTGKLTDVLHICPPDVFLFSFTYPNCPIN